MTTERRPPPPTMLLVVTGVGHGQKGTARALLDEFRKKRDPRSALVDLDDCLTGSELFAAARGETNITESTLEKIQALAMDRTSGNLQHLVALDPVAGRLVSNALPGKPLALVQCGVTADARWPVEAASMAIVPDQAAAKDFLARGMSSDRIVPLGIPLCPGFALGPSTDGSEAAAQLGMDPARPIIILAAEALAPFDVLRAAKALAQPPGLLQVAVDLAGDWEADEAFKNEESLPDKDIRPFGKTDMAPTWWASADLVVCHPSDHIVSRALALGKPLVTLPPDRPSALRVIRAISDRQVGLAAKRWEDFPATVAKALSLLPKWTRATSRLRGGTAVSRITTALQAFGNGR